MPRSKSIEGAESRTTRDQRINLRTTARQEAIIRRAAAASDRTMTDFILESAVEQAERVLADRRWFFATAEQWAEFQRPVDEPLPATAKFERLAARPTPFIDE